MSEQWITCAEAEARTGMSERTIRRRIDAGLIRVMQPSPMLLSVEDLDRVFYEDASRAISRYTPISAVHPADAATAKALVSAALTEGHEAEFEAIVKATPAAQLGRVRVFLRDSLRAAGATDDPEILAALEDDPEDAAAYAEYVERVTADSDEEGMRLLKLLDPPSGNFDALLEAVPDHIDPLDGLQAA